MIPSLPETVNYNRTKNDFSARREFGVYVGGNQIGANITMAADGSITIPASSLSSLKTGDQFNLYQHYDYSSGSVTYYTRVYFVNVKVDQPKIPATEYQALVDFYNAMGGPNWNNQSNIATNNPHQGASYGVSV